VVVIKICYNVNIVFNYMVDCLNFFNNYFLIRFNIAVDELKEQNCLDSTRLIIYIVYLF